MIRHFFEFGPRMSPWLWVKLYFYVPLVIWKFTIVNLQVGAETFRLCRELLDGVLLVDNQSISGAIEAVFNDKRSILEPAGAVAVAGATQYIEKHNLQVYWYLCTHLWTMYIYSCTYSHLLSLSILTIYWILSILLRFKASLHIHL